MKEVGYRKKIQKWLFIDIKKQQKMTNSAQYNLGRFYEDGNGIEKDEVKAHE